MNTQVLGVLWVLLLLLLPATAQSQTEGSWIPMEGRKLCNRTDVALSMLKEGQFEPIVTSRVNGSQFAVWLNEKREVLATTTANLPNSNVSVTCIVAVGTEHTWLNPDAFSKPGGSF